MMNGVVVSRARDEQCLDGPEMPFPPCRTEYGQCGVGEVCLEVGLLPFGRNATMAMKEFLEEQHT